MLVDEHHQLCDPKVTYKNDFTHPMSARPVTKPDDQPVSPVSAVEVTAQHDLLWSALNDGSRRTILDLLRRDSMTTTQICLHFAFSRFAVMKHLKALEKANLIVIERRGRERINHLNPVPLQEIYHRWIRHFEKLPADRMLRIKAIAQNP